MLIMRLKSSVHFSCLFVALMLMQLISCNVLDNKTNNRDNQDGPREAVERDIEMMKDPTTGKVPVDRLLNAYEYKRDLLQQTNLGPLPNVNWSPFGPKNQGGRTRAMIIDLNDASGNTVFAGSVGGGLWKTTNINTAAPNWAPVNDMLSNLAVSALVQDPSNPQVMYMGTGEGYNNSDAIRGLGIFKSTNGGNTWTQLPSTNNTNFYYNLKMQVLSSGVLLVATRAGLYRSADGGASFTRVLGTGLGITGANSNLCYDVQISRNGDVYGSLNGSVHKSTDGANTFSAALVAPVTLERVEVACAPSDNNVVYFLVERANTVEAILKSTDGGATFVVKTEPDDADGGIPASDFSRGQAWYDLTICVDPNNANNVVVGGVDAFRSVDGGDTWLQLSHWYGGFGFQYMHADQHYFFYKPGSSSIAYFVNDGGIFQSTNMTAAVPTIVDKSTNYNTIQFYACAIDPTVGKTSFLAGAQDNGSHRYTTAGIQNTTQVTGGDGAFCHIDQNEPQFQFTSYVYNNFYRSTNGGVSFGSVNSGNTGRFINPTDYDDVDNKLYAAKGSNEYLVWMDPQTGNNFITQPATTLGGQVSAVKVSAIAPGRVFFGTSNGRVVKIDDAAGAAPTAAYLGNPGGVAAYISCVEVEKNNENHIVVCYSNYGVNSIWETLDAGTTWTSIEGNLPDMPVRWATLNPNNNRQLLIATELGVWSTDNITGTTTSWGATNSGLANVRVDMLQLRSSDGYVIAATHGRGLFGSDVFTQPTAGIFVTSRIGYTGNPIQFNSSSFQDVSWLWNFGDGTTSTLKNPAHAYATAGTYNVTLTINNGASTATENNLVQILPNRNAPYALADGGNFETNPGDFGNNLVSGTKWERGSSTIPGKSGTNSGANAWVTGLTSTVYADKGESQLWSPNYNFTGQTALTLSFFAKFNTEPEYDGFRIEYSLDKGNTWLPLGTTAAANWYNFGNTTQNTSFPINEAFFAGNVSTAFVQYSRNISFLAGNANVAFRANFKTDDNTNGPGAVIDDWTISGNTAPPTPVYALTSFTAARVNNDVQLNWMSVNESGYDKYYVQRSTTPTGFADVANLNATNLASNTYTYLDLTSALNPIPVGTLYYRLRITKPGNEDVFSEVRQVVFPAPVPPFALTNFTAAKINFDVQLNWNTVNEAMNGKYFVQRGTNINSFTDVANVDAQNAASNTYSYLDLTSLLLPRPTGKLYYRLRITRIGMPDTFSEIKEVDFTTVTAPVVFSVGPNPFTSYINIASPIAIKAMVLFASNGQVVQQSSNFPGGRWNIGRQLASGMYVLKVFTTDGKTYVRQLIK